MSFDERNLSAIVRVLSGPSVQSTARFPEDSTNNNPERKGTKHRFNVHSLFVLLRDLKALALVIFTGERNMQGLHSNHFRKQVQLTGRKTKEDVGEDLGLLLRIFWRCKKTL